MKVLAFLRHRMMGGSDKVTLALVASDGEGGVKAWQAPLSFNPFAYLPTVVEAINRGES